MELRHLRYFVAVAEEHSFARAARRLRVAQPALSRQIRDLEREVGVQLFERLARGTRMTRPGQAFLREARQALESASRAVTTVRRAATQSALVLAHTDLIIYAPLLLELVAGVRAARPDTPVRVVRINEVQQRAALVTRRIDAVLTVVPAWPVPDLTALQLGDAAATGVFLARTHPLAAQPRLQLRELVDLTWLHPMERARPEVFRALRAALASRGLVPLRHRGRRPDAAGDIPIAAGDAWALANPTVAARYAYDDAPIVYRPFVDPLIPMWLTLLWRGETAGPLVETLVEVARSVAGLGRAAALARPALP